MSWRLASASLLCLVFSQIAAQGPTDLSERMAKATDVRTAARILRQSRLYSTDPSFQRRVDDGLTMDEAKGLERIDRLSRTSVATEDPEAIVQEIKASPIYRDPGVAESSNWLKRSIDRLKNLLDRPEREDRDRWQGSAMLGPWITWVMWALLLVGVAVFALFAFRHAQWRRAQVKKASAILDEDEPERSVDDWLELAATHELKGEPRQAIRCLYLASLLLYDQHEVAKFDRGQTNWEHLSRIEASPKRIVDSDFRALTKAFDLAWYGGIVQADRDIPIFRSFYIRLKERFEEHRP